MRMPSLPDWTEEEHSCSFRRTVAVEDGAKKAAMGFPSLSRTYVRIRTGSRRNTVRGQGRKRHERRRLRSFSGNSNSNCMHAAAGSRPAPDPDTSSSSSAGLAVASNRLDGSTAAAEESDWIVDPCRDQLLPVTS